MHTTDRIDREINEQQGAIQRLEQNIQEVENEVRCKQFDAEKLTSEIQERKDVLNKAKRTTSELDTILCDLKKHV